jgi:hypothetical protein
MNLKKFLKVFNIKYHYRLPSPEKNNAEFLRSKGFKGLLNFIFEKYIAVNRYKNNAEVYIQIRATNSLICRVQKIEIQPKVVILTLWLIEFKRSLIPYQCKLGIQHPTINQQSGDLIRQEMNLITVYSMKKQRPCFSFQLFQQIVHPSSVTN